MNKKRNLGPWLLAGTGPSLRQVEGEHRIVTCNRALAFFDKVMAAFIYHSLTLEALENHLHKTGYIVIPDPLDSYLDWANGRFVERAVGHRLFKSTQGTAWMNTPRQLEPMLRCREFQQASGCLAPGPCSIGALGWLVKYHDITEIRTVGIDGGTETHPALADVYSNRTRHPIGSYDRSAKQFGDACDLWGVRWIKL